MSTPASGIAAKVLSNSFWNVLLFLVTAIVGIAVSILTARYLGSAAFGVLSYVVWLTTVIATIAGLGLDQVVFRYVPGWVSNAGTRAWALRVAWLAVTIELVMGTILVGALITLFPWWSRGLTFEHSGLGVVMAVGLVSVLPVVVSRCVGSFLRSIQSSRELVIVSLVSQAANLALVLTAVAFRLPLIAFVTAGLIAHTVLATGLVLVLRRQARTGEALSGQWPTREMAGYSLIAYAHVLLQQVVWSRSETLFLGVFSPSPEIGYYGLAYAIAGMIGGIVGVSQQALFAAQFELLATDQEARSDRLASLSVKYLALLFLPVFLVAWLFVDSAVMRFYGPAYATVARVFPYLVLGAIVANVLNPVVTKISLSNRKFAATLGIALAGAGINVTLDLLLIPAHHAWGAAVANCASQLCVVGVSMVFVARVSPVRLDLRAIGAVALVNALLAGLVWLVLSRANIFALKLLMAAAVGAVYLPWLAAWGVFDESDRARLTTLEGAAPRWLRPVFHLVRGSLGRVPA